MTKSKRFRMTVGALAINFLLVLLALFLKTDLIALGTTLAMINAPLYTYLWGETARPSNQEKN